jgi:hypothetical protein
MTVYVYLWFDIEDYVTKESDGLVLDAARILRKYDIPVTCKVVAEKVRALQANGRSDVISTISEYDVGYHLDKHSRHPTVYEYLADENVVEGAADFRARETEGLHLVSRTFKRSPSCFGHPGSAWAPHFYPALKDMGIPVYLDETPVMNLDNAPYWYCGVLNLNGANENFILFDRCFEDPAGLRKLEARFRRIHDNLEKDGGFVSILFHLHTAINRKFWDEINFGNGRNRKPSEYVRPPAQPRNVTERAWEDFDAFMKYVSSFRDVKFITARDAARMLRREETVEANRGELKALAEGSRRRIDFALVGGYYFSPAQIFYAVTSALKEYKKSRRVPAHLTIRDCLGPMESFNPRERPKSVTMAKLLDACESAADFVDLNGYMPDKIVLAGGERLAPADFLSTASSGLAGLLEGGSMPPVLRFRIGKFMGTRHISANRFRWACRWNVLPANFRAPKILEQMRLQTWTLVPAIVPGTRLHY